MVHRTVNTPLAARPQGGEVARLPAERIRQLPGKRLYAVVLPGSTSRGEDGPDSAINLLVMYRSGQINRFEALLPLNQLTTISDWRQATAPFRRDGFYSKTGTFSPRQDGVFATLGVLREVSNYDYGREVTDDEAARASELAAGFVDQGCAYLEFSN